MADPNSLPVSGSTDWYTYATSLHNAVTSKLDQSGDTMQGLLALNSNWLLLKGDSDYNHGIVYDGGVDGPRVNGWGGGTLEDNSGVAVAWDPSDVTINRPVNGQTLGDTGWRNVSASLINGWTGNLFIRRTGQVVEFSTLNGSLDGSAASGVRCFDGAGGFDGYRPTTSGWAIRGVVLDAAGTPGEVYQGTGSGNNLNRLNMPSAGGANDEFSFSFTFTTTDAWPGSLPGVAA